MKTILTTAAILIFGLTTSFGQTSKGYGSLNSKYKTTTGSSYTLPSIYNTKTSNRYQSGYSRSNGTYVQPHNKTKANKTNLDNYSTKGNYNPYTGKNGTRAKDYSSSARNYGSGKVIHTGSRGGQYYINSKGNKTYVPKQ